MSKILLINPSYFGSYGSAKASTYNPIFPTLGLTTIAAVALERGHEVEILDLSFKPYSWMEVKSKIVSYCPDVVGITSTTPLMNQLRDISILCKDISKNILVVGGGSHASAMPYESMAESFLDIVISGEGDFTFGDICDGMPLKEILGIYYRNSNNEILFTGNRPYIENLDTLPIPAWHLYKADEYKHRMSRLLAKTPPVTMAEFSRGCIYKCDFCASKITMALGYRKKSPKRCAEEVKIMHSLGWKEFLLADDIFTSHHKWAIDVCNAIADTGLDMAWSCTNGIRVESADEELFSTMKRAGCYRVSFGFESGSDEILKAFGKGGQATIEQGHVAVNKARQSGIDTVGFFMLGLSPDTEESMNKTIDYARTLKLDMLKFGITIAFPGTPMFNEYAKLGLIKSYDWDEYHIYTEKALFALRNLSYEKILEFMPKAYRKAIFSNPGFIMRRIIRGIKTGEFFWDIFYGIKFALMPATSKTVRADYYARDRWPIYDYAVNPLRPIEYQSVKKKKEITIHAI